MTTDPKPEEVAAVLAALEALDEHKRYNKMLYFTPYPAQRAFLALSKKLRECGFIAGNRVGKSETGAFAVACHLTGDYPDWWEGRKYDHPIKCWVAGTTSLDVRNVAQTKLCGQFGVVRAFGSGFIPKDRIADKPTLARGVTDAFDTVQVVHKTNGVVDGTSLVSFKSYEQGREKFQGDDIDLGWCDEEPDQPVYDEFLTRIENGHMLVTLTPMLGPTKLYNRYTEELSPNRGVVHMTLDEAEHFTAEEKARRIDGYDENERDARRYGTPQLGEGRIFKFPIDMFSEPQIDYLPPHWAKIWGIDFGIGHPFAAALIAWDRDNDAIHVLDCFKQAGTQPIHHAAAMRAIASDVPVAWPQDGTRRVQGETTSGPTLATIYKNFGLKMLHEHATWPEGGYSTWAAIEEIKQRITTNRFKVASHLAAFFEEYRFYHLKKGEIVKVRDDILSAVYKAIMMNRYAKAVTLGSSGLYTPGQRGGGSNRAKGVDFDPF